MAVAKNHKLLLKKLQKQINVLQRKEERSKNKLKAALKKLQKLTKTYKSKIASKIRIMKVKLGEARSSTYAKIAADIERQLMKEIAAKGKSISNALDKLEKKHSTKLTKGITKKSKKSPRKIAKTASAASTKIKINKLSGKTKSARTKSGNQKGKKSIVKRK